jgi:hypothetical protein
MVAGFFLLCDQVSASDVIAALVGSKLPQVM